MKVKAIDTYRIVDSKTGALVHPEPYGTLEEAEKWALNTATNLVRNGYKPETWRVAIVHEEAYDEVVCGTYLGTEIYKTVIKRIGRVVV